MLVNQLHQGGVRALLDYDNTLFNNMTLPDGIDIQNVVDNIIFKYGDAPLYAPDPAVMKFYIGRWSTRRQSQWTRMKDLFEMEYNPIENYDRTEDSSDDLTHGLTVENMISADNAIDYQEESKGINSGTDSRKTHIRTHGNIGVTTSQQMLLQEKNLIPELNIIDYITEDFHSEFCMLIY